MAYTVSQIISFVLFLILICLSVLLVVMLSSSTKNGGGFFDAFKTSAASAASSAASSLKTSATSAASSLKNAAAAAGTTIQDAVVIQTLADKLLVNQIKLTPKEYLTNMKSLYNENEFKSYINDTMKIAKYRMELNNALIAEYQRRQEAPTVYVKESNTYPGLIDKYNADNVELQHIIDDCNTLLQSNLVNTLHTEVEPIIDTNISKMTTTRNLKGTDLMSSAKQAAINFANSLPKSGPTAFGV